MWRELIVNAPQPIAILASGDVLYSNPASAKHSTFSPPIKIAWTKDSLDTFLFRDQQRVQHLTTIVSRQHYAGKAAPIETCSLAGLIDDALALVRASCENHDIALVREVADSGAIDVDRHRILQIMVNLLSNAEHALVAAQRPAKEIRIEAAHSKNDRFHIRVKDNGVGITRSNLDKIFKYGFTAKKAGHGFGLHSAVNAARAMGGELTCPNDGDNCGAAFTLELPVHAPQGGA